VKFPKQPPFRDKIMNDCDCKDKTQCWEPCGELGHSEEHVRVPTDEEFNRLSDQIMLERKELLLRLKD